MNLRGSRRRREEATIDLTPLIDIVFLLLIFFLLTSAVSQQSDATSRDSAIRVDLPEAQSGNQDIQGDPVMLTVNDAGEVFIEGGSAELVGESVEEKLLNLYKQDPQMQLLLRGDKGATHGRVVELLDAVKQIGFKRVDLVIARPASAPP